MSKPKETEESELLEMWAEACRRAEEEVCIEPVAEFTGDIAIEWALRMTQLAHQLKGVACEKCQGAGQRVYPSTATWRGGLGGAAMTTGVCDRCWGTGRSDEGGPNLRKLEASLRESEKGPSRRWFEERIGSGTKIMSQGFNEIAQTLRNARWVDFWTTRAAEVIADALVELSKDPPSRKE